MKNKIFSVIAVIGVFVIATRFFGNSLDPIESIKEHEVKGKTYATILAESGRCDNPQWVQETPRITWQDHSRSDTVTVSVTCHSKSKVKTVSDNVNVEEKVIFNLQYLKKGRYGRKSRHTNYHVDAGAEYYILTVNGKEKLREFHPYITQIFSNQLVIED